MSTKLTPDHLARSAVIYVRQSTPGQVVEHTESKKRQYALAEAARGAGFVRVAVIDDDLGRSGSGAVERPGFQKLVAAVIDGTVGAVYCIEASRLARNGRDWHHLVDLCAMVGALVIDPDGVYDPRLINDRLLLGLKGTMSEYELSLLRQRGLAARDSKARRGELQFVLPPGYCWGQDGRIEMDPDEHVGEAIRLVFRKFRELGSARQVFLWLRAEALRFPVVDRNSAAVCRLRWRDPGYRTVLALLQSPIYAGAYAFGRRGQRTRVVDGRARKTEGHRRERSDWLVLKQDNHPGYISWATFEANQQMLAENAHMKKRAARKAARGGRALLTGLARCGRCGRMMQVSYNSSSTHPHRYQCRGNDEHVGPARCIGIGGGRVDRTVTEQILEAVSPHAVDAAILAAEQATHQGAEIRAALSRQLEDASYTAKLAERRYEAVDPDKRHVARALEARWNAALEHVAELEDRISQHDRETKHQPDVDRLALMQLAHDLPAVWHAPGTDAGTKQRLVHILIREVVIDLDEARDEVVMVIHWTGGRHTEVRMKRLKTGRYPANVAPAATEVMRKLGGHWPDRDLAVTMNRMRCKTPDGETWTTVRVRDLRERLGIAEYDPDSDRTPCISVDAAAKRLNICVGSVYKLIREGVLPATQLMYSAPWEIPVAALDSEEVRIGLQQIAARRPRRFAETRDSQTITMDNI